MSDSTEPKTSSSTASSSSGTSTAKKQTYKSESNQVRYTGDWSSDSKLSAIFNGYWEDPFFRFFNQGDPTKIRRTSLICRGYYVRFRVCDFFIRKMIRELNQPIQIVSLGCGMDTTYFRILPELENFIQKFYELDFRSVISAKKSIILHNEILQVMAKDRLVLLHCDLRDATTLEEALKVGGFDFSAPTLFYSECVVNYLRPHENSRILQWITANVPNSIWLAYEQCNANDSFGQIMVSHFLRNGCPLLSLLSAQSREEQEDQLKKAGFAQARVINAWDAFVKIGEQNPPYFPQVNQQEQQFDEYEQLLATCLHYSVRLGVLGVLVNSGVHKMFDSFEVKSSPEALEYHHEITTHSTNLHVKSFATSCLPKLTGHKAIFKSDGTILTFGGSGENSMRMKHLIASNVITNVDNSSGSGLKLSDVPEEPPPRKSSDTSLRVNVHSQLKGNTKIISENASYYERLHADATYIASGTKEGESWDSVLIFGGRKSPMIPCTNDLIEINLENFDFQHGEIASVILSSKYGKCPPPRWRHSMVLCTKNGLPHLLLFGGRSTEEVLGDCWWYSIEDYAWCQRESKTSTSNVLEPEGRHSHSMIADPEKNLVYLIGGVSVDDVSLCKDSFWVFDCGNDIWAPVEEFNYVSRRIGHTSEKLGNLIVTVGGYGADSSYGLDFFASVINLENKSIKIINQVIPRDEIFLPFGFASCVTHREENQLNMLVFGGGGNCFSFGTHYNQICYEIEIKEIVFS